MQADWTIACGADDPVVFIPWANAEGSARYVDLRANPSAIGEIPEATQYPCVAAALKRWNHSDSSLFTAKCDIWNYPARLFDAEDLSTFAYGQGSYIDLIATEPEIFSRFVACEKLLRAWTETAQGIEFAEGRCEATLRPARIYPMVTALDDVYERGFSITLYVWGYGDSPAAAEKAWSSALEAMIEPVIHTMTSQIARIVE